MDGRLNDHGTARRAGFVVLAVVVALLHLALTRELADRLGSIDPAGAMPKRMEATYVRVIEPEAPPTLAPFAAAAPVAPRAARVASPPARAASAAEPVPEVVAEAAPSEPPVAEAAEVLPAISAVADTAASAPAVAAAASDSAPAAGPVAFEWPLSTRVSYILTGNYRGELSGSAQVEWLRQGDRYQVHLDLVAGPEFAPIFSRRMSSEGRIEASGLAPERYDEDTQAILRERRRATVTFESDAVVLANGQRRERLAGVQDTASQFVQFSFLFSTRPDLLKVGNTFELPLALPRGMTPWIYDVVAEDTLATPFGPLAAYHLKPRRPVRKNGELTAEIWFAPELHYLPVRIRIEQDATTFIDLMIARKPEVAAS